MFNPCDPYLNFEVKLLITFVAPLPTDDSDKVWLKSDEACRRRSKLWEIMQEQKYHELS